MLLDFRIKNYKSFKNEARINLIPAPKQKDLEYSILKKIVANKEYKGLSTAVLYGPNAAGKTNIIGAIDTLIQLVDRGHINNVDKSKSLNVSSVKLELIPNSEFLEAKPVEFYISFIKGDNLFEYHLKVNLGIFLDESYKREVLEERLVINSVDEFLRTNKEVIVSNEYTEIKKLETLLTSNLNDTELFISNGYKTLVNNFLYNEFINYLNNDVTVLYRADAISIAKRADDDRRIIKSKELSLVAKEIGSINSDVGFAHKEKEAESKLISFFKRDDMNVGIQSDIIESYGTIRFLNLYPIIKRVLTSGGVLVIDEFDASIHPMVLLDIVNIFHNDEINVKKAQLIFNTHNPVFLNSSVLRRDEIKFVEKDENGSTIYSLADFQTSGKSGVRKTDDYMKHYFINKYGAILDVDLSDLFEVRNEKTE